MYGFYIIQNYIVIYFALIFCLLYLWWTRFINHKIFHLFFYMGLNCLWLSHLLCIIFFILNTNKKNIMWINKIFKSVFIFFCKLVWNFEIFYYFVSRSCKLWEMFFLNMNFKCKFLFSWGLHYQKKRTIQSLKESSFKFYLENNFKLWKYNKKYFVIKNSKLVSPDLQLWLSQI